MPYRQIEIGKEKKASSSFELSSVNSQSNHNQIPHSSGHVLLSLQNQFGNQYVQRLINPQQQIPCSPNSCWATSILLLNEKQTKLPNKQQIMGTPSTHPHL